MLEERIANGEVMETAEEIVKTGSGKGLKTFAGLGLAVIIGGVTYKYIVKPIVAKRKAKKENETMVFVNPEPEIVVNPDNESEED